MKISSVLAALIATLPSAFAGKPRRFCHGNNEPSLSLGGYNVPVSNFSDPLDMVDSLWRQQLLDYYNVTITPFLDFNPRRPEDGMGTDADFAFEQDGAHWRGVGVANVTVNPNPQISQDEAICVSFGGLTVRQVFFGVRAFFDGGDDERPRDLVEDGLVLLYRENGRILKDKFIRANDGDDDDDGQEHYRIQARRPFDKICFITRSNDAFGRRRERGHDYFLEYIDLCSSTGKPDNICDISDSEPNFFLGGYDVPVNDDFPTGIAMVESLWRKTLLNQFDVQIYPSRRVNVSNPTQFLGGDSEFGFDQKDGLYWRGVGVNSTGDEQIDNREGLYVNFGGLAVTELFFGLRDHFPRGGIRRRIPEFGIVYLYSDGDLVNGGIFWANDFWDVDDGQEHFHIVSDVEFDSMVFATLTRGRRDFGDYFVEYVDLCCAPDASVKGDPHIQTWSGMKYDFHGVCDLVLLQNPDFQDGLGMDIHIRTKQLKQFSYVSSAVLRIGEETLEVMGDLHENLYWINKQPNGSLVWGISGYPISYRKVNSKQHEFIVELGEHKSIVIKTFRKFVHVSFVGATKESFGTSRGLLGSFGSGTMLARDNITVMEDMNEFGQEWQVRPSEIMLFHNVDGPQAPAKCEIPVASNLRRRLGESVVSEEEAEIACARVNPEDHDMCVFDVMATGDKDVVGAY